MADPVSTPSPLQKTEDGSYIFKYKAKMSCGGCSNAIINKLDKIDNVVSVKADHSPESQEVTVVYKPEDGTSAAQAYDKVKTAIPKQVTHTYPPADA